jgi:hypothetical protein
MRGVFVAVVLLLSVVALSALDPISTPAQITSIEGAEVIGPIRGPILPGEPIVTLYEIERDGKTSYLSYRSVPIELIEGERTTSYEDGRFTWMATYTLMGEASTEPLVVIIPIPESTHVAAEGLVEHNATSAHITTVIPATVTISGYAQSQPEQQYGIDLDGARIEADEPFSTRAIRNGLELLFASTPVVVTIDTHAIAWVETEDRVLVVPINNTIRSERNTTRITIFPAPEGHYPLEAFPHLPSDPDDLIEATDEPLYPQPGEVIYTIDPTTGALDARAVYEEPRIFIRAREHEARRASHLPIKPGARVTWNLSVTSGERVVIPGSARDIRIDEEPSNLSVAIAGSILPIERLEELHELKEIEDAFLVSEKSRRYLLDIDANRRYRELKESVSEQRARSPRIDTHRLSAREPLIVIAQSNATLTYTTEPPQITQRPTPPSRPGVATSEIIVSSELGYTSVPSRAALPAPATHPDQVRFIWFESVNGSNITRKVPFELHDDDSDGAFDTITWTTPHLSKQLFRVIVITSGVHFDTNGTFIADVYDQINRRDGVLTDPIPDGHVIRVSFEENLTSENDITIYARTISGDPWIDVASHGSGSLVAAFEGIEEGYHKRFLTGLVGEEDTFDLIVRGGSVEFDYITDPPSTGLHLRYDADSLELNDTDLVASWTDLVSSNNATQSEQSERPTYLKSILSGRAIVRFTGSESLTTADPIGMSGDDPYSIVSVARANTTSDMTLFRLGSGDPNEGSALTITSGTWMIDANNTGDDWNTSEKADTDWHIHSISSNGTRSTWYLDQESLGTHERTPNHTSTFTISAASGSWDGDVAEILVYDRELSPIERRQAERALAERWLSWEPFNPIRYENPTPGDGIVSTEENFTINATLEDTPGIVTLDFGFNDSNVSFYDSDLVLMYNLDQITTLGETSTHIRDMSLNGKNASAQGNAAPTTNGLYNGAFSFDGTNDWIETTSTSGLGEGTQQLTLMTWVYDTANDANPRGIISKRFGTGSTGRSYSLFMHSGRLINLDIGSDRHAGATAIPANEWVHIAVVFDGTASSGERKRFYINGEPDVTRTSSQTSVPSGSAPVHIGILNANYGNSWQGRIDEPRIYTRALTSDEIAEHYRSNLNRVDEYDWRFASSIENLTEQEYEYALYLESDEDYSAERTYTVDTTAPLLTFVVPTPTDGGLTGADPITINLTITDENRNGSTIRIYNASGLIAQSTNNTNPHTASFNALPEGVYWANATATDLAGQANESTTITFRIDRQDPQIEYESPTELSGSIIARSNIIVNASASDAFLDEIAIRLYFSNGSLAANGSTNETVLFSNFTSLSDGFYRFNATANDLAGNDNTTVTRNVTIDTTPPAISVVQPINDTTYLSENVTIEFSATDLNGVDSRWFFNTTHFVPYTGPVNVTLQPGNYTFTFYANDTVNNTASVQRTFEVDPLAIDEDPPVLTIHNPQNTTYAISNILINLSGVDNVAIDTIRYENGSGDVEYTSVTSETFTEGSHTLFAHANDTSNNTASANVTFLIDTIDPAIAFELPTPIDGASLSTDSFTANVSASDANLVDVTVFLYYSNGTLVQSDSSTGPFFVSYSALTDGVYVLNATATDIAGNMNTTDPRTITIDTIEPSISFEPLTPEHNQEIGVDFFTANVSASDANLVDVTVFLYYSNGTLVQSDSSTGPFFVSYSALTDGVYVLNATATDIAGNMNTTDPRTITIDTIEPSISFIEPTPDDEEVVRIPNLTITAQINESSLKEASFTFNGTSTDYYDENLQLMFGFDQIASLSETSTTAQDHSRNAYIGSISTATQSSDAIAGGSLRFTGSDLVRVNSFANLSGSNQATIMAWVKQDTLSTGQYLLWADGNVLIEYGSTFGSIQGSDVIRVRWHLQGDWGNTHAVTALEADSWQHWAFVYSSGATRIYRDGIEIYSGSDSQTSFSSNSPNYDIGLRASGMDGWIDEFRVYDRALSGSEIEEHARGVLRRTDPDEWEFSYRYHGIPDATYPYELLVTRTNDNTADERRNVTIDTRADLEIENIAFTPPEPIEGETVNVTFSIANSGYRTAENFTLESTVEYWNGTWNEEKTLTHENLTISGNASIDVNASWNASIGRYRFTVIADSTSVIDEYNESNNEGSSELSVSAWTIIYGTVDLFASLENALGLNLFEWMVDPPGGVVLYADADASYLPGSLAGLNESGDLALADIALGMTYFNDSISALWDETQSGVADTFSSITIAGTLIENVPIIDSTPGSSFFTGILYDTADGAVYDGGQDLVFVTVVNASMLGSYGVYDYEIRVPSRLRYQYDGVDLVERSITLE